MPRLPPPPHHTDAAGAIGAHVGTRDPGTSASSNLLDLTVQAFQPLSRRPLTRENAREIVRNVAGAYSILLRWDRRARASAGPDATADTADGGRP